MSAGRDDLFSRWSRRKQAVRRLEAEEAAAARASEAEADAEAAGAPHAAAEPVPEVSADATVEPPPSLDDLTAEGDLSRFLAEGVPKALRNAAMRKMWSLDPAIRDHVGLSENSWNFNEPGSVPGFGPLEAGRAVVNFLSKIVEETPADPPSAPAEIGPTVVLAEAAADPPEAPDAPDAQPVAEPAPSEAAEDDRAAEPRAELPRPRHGGAVPQ